MDDGHAALAMVGLYNALSCYAALDSREMPLPVWDDLDQVVDMHRLQDIVAFNHNPDTIQPFREYNTWMGLDADKLSSFLRDTGILKARRKWPSTSEDEDDGVRYRPYSIYSDWSAGVMQMVTNNAYFCQAHMTSLEQLQTMLKRLAADRANRQAREQAVQAAALTDGHTPPKRQIAIQLRRAKKHKSNKFSMAQVLAVLELALSTDVDQLYFDHVAFYLDAVSLLDPISKAIDDYYGRAPSTGKLILQAEGGMRYMWAVQLVYLLALRLQSTYGGS